MLRMISILFSTLRHAFRCAFAAALREKRHKPSRALATLSLVRDG